MKLKSMPCFHKNDFYLSEKSSNRIFIKKEKLKFRYAVFILHILPKISKNKKMSPCIYIYEILAK